MRQLSFEFFKNFATESGGSLFNGKRKTKRVLAVKTPIHLVIRSDKAKGLLNFTRHEGALAAIIQKISAKHGVRVYSKAINFNHIHFVICLRSVVSYKNWIRELTQKIVYLLSQRTKQKLSQFFTLRPYTRLLTWGRQFRNVLDYLVLNQMEVLGLGPLKKIVFHSNSQEMESCRGYGHLKNLHQEVQLNGKIFWKFRSSRNFFRG